MRIIKNITLKFDSADTKIVQFNIQEEERTAEELATLAYRDTLELIELRVC
jgi:hypothetical protein